MRKHGTQSVPTAFPRRAWEREDFLNLMAVTLRVGMLPRRLGIVRKHGMQSVPPAFPRGAWERGDTRDVFALASNTALDLSEVISRFIQVPLTSTERANLVLQWVKISAPQGTNPEEFFVKLLVVNNSHQTISSSPPYPVNIAYHWLLENGEVIEYDGVRTTLPGAIVPHSKTPVWIRVKLPVNRQRTVYRLVISLVQEAVAWFDQDNPAHPISVKVSF